MYFPIAPHSYETLLFSSNMSQKIYKFISQDAILIHNKYIKWMSEIGHDFCEGLLDFAQKHTNIYKITNVAKYRSFQYRLLQRGIVTNIQLCAWKIIDSELCSFCGQQRETTLHLVHTCPHAVSLWDNVLRYITQRFNIQHFDMSSKAVLFNEIAQPARHIANFICLLTKQYIYRQRCLKQDISFPQFKAHVRKIENIEKYIAIKNDKLAKHNKKWCIHSDTTDIVSVNDYIRQYLE